MNLQDLLAAIAVGNADLDLAVEPAAAPQGGVDGVDAVGRADDDHLAALL